MSLESTPEVPRSPRFGGLTGSLHSFRGYDNAVNALNEAREILALSPDWTPAKERVEDAHKRVVFEIGKLSDIVNQYKKD